MEIDLSGLAIHKRSLFLGLVILGILILLALLGWYILSDGRVLSWTEWQVFKQEYAYQCQLNTLTSGFDDLSELLAAPPDPVRASLVTEQIRGEMDTITIPALADQRGNLLNASDAIEAWALGVTSKDTAVKALKGASKALNRAVRVLEASDE